MTGRRKGTPCACETDPCGCGSSKGKCVRAVNNVSPDPNGDLTIRGGAGIKIIQSGDDLVINNTANPNAFVAGRNIELNPSEDDITIDLVDKPVVDGLTINGDLEVNGDIIQKGAAYETHAEKIYTRDDYIIVREGAVAALPQGDYSGFQVKLYDGVNDGRLVIDNAGVARVGDVGDEQPLLTREESADLTDGALLKWDAANMKAIDEGTVGDDAHPVKISAGVATPISRSIEYLPGDSITIAANQIYGNGYLNFNNVAQVLIPLTKPISPLVTTITFSDPGTVRCNGYNSAITLIAIKVVPGGIAITASTTINSPEHACAIRGGTSGTIISFS